MRAVRFHDYLGLDGVRLEDMPIPVPRTGEILVRIHAAGVNPFDCYAVSGYVNAYVRFTLPAVLGRDFSGIVAAIGPEVEELSVGDAVFGQSAADADGTFADFVAIPASRAAIKPGTLSHIEAASLPNVIMAAWDGLFSMTSGMDLQPGQTILVNGAAGGIGSMAVQLARWRGARVIGTSSASNLDMVRELGAEAYDYTLPLAITGPVDGVLDTADGNNAETLCGLVRPGGTYVALRGLTGSNFAERWAARGVRCVVANGPASAGAFPDMVKVVSDGEVRPIVSATYPLDQFRAALEMVVTGHARGKIVLQIAD
ncbi:NADP-dependent oxidoreductase [Novosphingobium lentum]|uniref:NADP-dependent oxidoreductase n=1 Tax=Novosphingobium lentum TaxID=145287 RepID=UPI0008309287|nr:NADP-dependent oxidoreductase [Novosphingobium lentum]